MELLKKFKATIGDQNGSTELDGYYTNFLNIANADLITDDIEKEILESELGENCIVLYAKALMEEKEPLDNKTILLLRNKLSAITKGNRYDPRGTE